MRSSSLDDKFPDNIFTELRDVDPDTLKKVYESIYPYPKHSGIFGFLEKIVYKICPKEIYILKYGDGRSKNALNIGFSGLSALIDNIHIGSRDTSDSLGSNIINAVHNIIQDNKIKINPRKCVIFAVSGSGKSTFIEEVKKLEKYLDDNPNSKKNTTINAITSYLESPLGEISTAYGNTLLLKGRLSSSGVNEEYLKKGGNLGDLFELRAMYLSHLLKTGIEEKVLPNKFVEYYIKKIEEMEKIIPEIDKIRKTEVYKDLVKSMSNKEKTVIYYALGVGNEVGAMADRRAEHIRKEYFDAYENYNSGTDSNTPKINSNTLGIFLSRSGTACVEQRFIAEKAGAEVFTITCEGSRNSDLVKDVKNVIYLPNSRTFYCDESVLLSLLLVDLLVYGKDNKLIKGDITNERTDKVHTSDKIIRG